MISIDKFSTTLLEEAKRFLEKATETTDQTSATAYCHASLLLGFSSLEAHMNALADELGMREGLDTLEKSILQEKDFILRKGAFELKKELKMYRLEDRLLFLFARFSNGVEPTTHIWWGELKGGMDLRNRLVHPKDPLQLTPAETAKAMTAIIECLNALFMAIFKRPHPSYNRKLDSMLTF